MQPQHVQTAPLSTVPCRLLCTPEGDASCRRWSWESTWLGALWMCFVHPATDMELTHQCSSVAQLCPTLCDPMDCSTQGLTVHHQLLEFIQTHVHWVSDAIQPFHPLSAPSPPAFNLSQHQSLFQRVGSLHQVAKASASASLLPMNIQDWSPLGLMVGSPCSPRDSQESSPTPQIKRSNSLELSFLYSPPLTSIHDHWKNHHFD